MGGPPMIDEGKLHGVFAAHLLGVEFAHVGPVAQPLAQGGQRRLIARITRADDGRAFDHECSWPTRRPPPGKPGEQALQELHGGGRAVEPRVEPADLLLERIEVGDVGVHAAPLGVEAVFPAASG